MAVITSIKSQKKHQRFNIYLDGKFALGVSGLALAKMKLKVGQLIDKKKLKSLKEQDSQDKAHDQVLRFLSYRPRSEKEVKDYLQKKKKGVKTISGVTRRLKEQRLIDDTAFARWWLEQRIQFRPKGKRLLWLELRKKGVDPEVIDGVLAGYSQELSLAQKLAQKKLKTYRHLDPLEFRQKMTGFLARRGFDWGVIKKALEELKESG